MKRALLIAFGLMLVAGSAFAQADSTYAGLFTDEAHTTWTVSSTGFTPFTVYIYWLPSQFGLSSAEFKITAPSNVILSTITANPDIAVSLGTLTAGIAVSFGLNCEAAGVWVWTHHVSCFLTSSAEGIIELVPDPSAIPPFLGYASCEPGYPPYPIRKFTNICLNSTCGVATQTTTWGAIKSLF